MSQTDFDVVIDGVKAKTIRGGETPGYDLRYVRREITQQLISQAEDVVLSSRGDLRQMYQKSWAGGSTWWKPLLGPQNIDTYFQSNHMDVWSEPGKVVPTNKVVDAANTDLHDNCVVATDSDGDVYAIGSTNNVNASFLDVYKWTPASDAFVQETGYHSGVPNDEDPVHMVFDPNDKYFYVHNAGGAEITRFNPGTSAQDAAWLSGAGISTGQELLLHRQGIVQHFSGASAITFRLIDKSGPSYTTIFNDGLGLDLFERMDLSGTEPLVRRIKNSVNTPEGIYYAGNAFTEGQPIAWVFRVERDEAGNWIGNPIATLPVGTVVLGIAHHLGSVILLTSPNYRTLVKNDTTEAQIDLFSVDGQSGVSVLGSLLGGRDELDETPYALLGSIGAKLYIGGQKRLWVYDAARGGIHPAWEWETELSNGAYVAMAQVEDSDGDAALIFLGRDRIARVKVDSVDDPDTVTAFGDDETHYTLESNYFDGNLPFEEKELSGVEILRDAGDGDQEWTVQIAADDGAFADALVHSTTGETHAKADLSGTTGRRFRYKLIYQTKDTQRTALRGLIVKMASGRMVREWTLVLDGEELLNVDNEVVDPETFLDNMKTMAAKEEIIALSDNMQEQEQETDTATTVNVKVQEARFIKSTPGEATIQVSLVEAA